MLLSRSTPDLYAQDATLLRARTSHDRDAVQEEKGREPAASMISQLDIISKRQNGHAKYSSAIADLEVKLMEVCRICL